MATGPPGRHQPDKADQRADEPPRLEQRERRHLGGKASQHVEAAPIHVEIDEGEGAAVGKGRAVERQQQLAVFGMGVVIPAEPIVAERHQGDAGCGDEHRDRQPVEQRARLRLANCKPG
jgi:hypothetical protein